MAYVDIAQSTSMQLTGKGLKAATPCKNDRHQHDHVGCRSCIDGLWKIVRHEGPSVLWHGVNVSVLISVPMICMYLPMYDNLMAELDTSSTYAPLVAGSAARSMAVIATSPLELLKTRIQAAGAATHSHSKIASASINPLSTALQQMRSDLKVPSLWHMLAKVCRHVLDFQAEI